MTQFGEQPLPHPAAAYYQPPGSAGSRPKDLTGMGVVAFAAAAVATLGAAAAALAVGRAARIRGEEGMDALDWSLGVYYAGELVLGLGMVAAWVAGSMWLFRARRNCELLSRDHHSRRSGWAWAGWVVPVVALWFPFQVVRDVRRAVAPPDTAALLGWWWALFVATEIGLWQSLRLQGTALVGLHGAPTARTVSVLTAAVMVAALAAWGQVLRAITSEQHDRMYGRI